MGCCESSDTALDAELRTAQAEDLSTRKVLFLGPGGSGKSTMFRQVRRMYGSKFSESERANFKDHIHDFVLSSLRALYISDDPELEDELLLQDLGQLTEAGRESAKFLWGCGKRIDSTVAPHIKQFWAEPTVRDAFDIYANLNLAHTCAKFIEDVDRLAATDYVPSDRDILWQRRTTAGLIEQEMEIAGERFKLVDVGGQKSERRKWEHQFTDVSVVVFVVSLSAFDEKVWEDENANGLEIALSVFKTVCNTQWLVKPDIVVFFNKEDLFKRKVESGVELKTCPVFSEYMGEAKDTDAAACAIIEKFVNQFKASKMALRQSTVSSEIKSQVSARELYTEVTCAYDEESIKTAFQRLIAALPPKMPGSVVQPTVAATDDAIAEE